MLLCLGIFCAEPGTAPSAPVLYGENRARRQENGSGCRACASRVLCVRLGACWGFSLPSTNKLAYLQTYRASSVPFVPPSRPVPSRSGGHAGSSSCCLLADSRTTPSAGFAFWLSLGLLDVVAAQLLSPAGSRLGEAVGRIAPALLPPRARQRGGRVLENS